MIRITRLRKKPLGTRLQAIAIEYTIHPEYTAIHQAENALPKKTAQTT